MQTLLDKGRILLGLLLAAAGLLGCTGKGEKQMLAYMEKKYREHFAMVGSYGGQLGKDYAMVEVRSRNRPKDIAVVRITYTEKGNIYQDNYMTFVLREEIEQKIAPLAAEIYGECKVYYKTSKLVFPVEYGPEMDAESFLKKPESMVMMFIYPKQEQGDNEEQIERLLELFREKQYHIKGVVSYPKEQYMYERIDRDNFFRDGWPGYTAKAEAVFSMNEDGTTKYIRWKGEETKAE